MRELGEERQALCLACPGGDVDAIDKYIENPNEGCVMGALVAAFAENNVYR